MTDAECIRFLQAAMSRLGLSWHGFRKVRRLVYKRHARRQPGDADVIRGALEPA